MRQTSRISVFLTASFPLELLCLSKAIRNQQAIGQATLERSDAGVLVETKRDIVVKLRKRFI
jgi:hypothetical protein